MTLIVKQNLTSKKGVPIASSVQKQLIKIQGTLTSSIQLRGEEPQESYYYSFIRLKGQKIDLPVIFKIKSTPVYEKFIKKYGGKYVNYSQCKSEHKDIERCEECIKNLREEFKKFEGLIKPNLKKFDEVELTGHYSNSEKSVRKSFTATSYQLLSEKRIRKKCVGCLDIFTCSPAKNYDYCSKCELNGSRYLNKDSPCSECDGSGLIKFKNQSPRSCKLCYLARQEKREDKLTK